MGLMVDLTSVNCGDEQQNVLEGSTELLGNTQEDLQRSKCSVTILEAKKLVGGAHPSPRSKEEAWEWAPSDLIGRR